MATVANCNKIGIKQGNDAISIKEWNLATANAVFYNILKAWRELSGPVPLGTGIEKQSVKMLT